MLKYTDADISCFSSNIIMCQVFSVPNFEIDVRQKNITTKYYFSCISSIFILLQKPLQLNDNISTWINNNKIHLILIQIKFMSIDAKQCLGQLFNELFHMHLSLWKCAITGKQSSLSYVAVHKLTFVFMCEVKENYFKNTPVWSKCHFK